MIEMETNVAPFTAETAARRLLDKFGGDASRKALQYAHDCFADGLPAIGAVWYQAMRLIEVRGDAVAVN